MKIILTITLTILSMISIGQNVDSLYQKILDHFADNYLNKSLYDNECTTLKGSKPIRILVNLDSTLWTVEPFIIGQYFDIALENKLFDDIDSATWNWLISYKTYSKLNIDLQKLKNFKKTHLTKAPKETLNKSDLLRLSAPRILGNYSYIELWIKRDFHSSGTRIIYKIDSTGNIIQTKKYNLCDDLG